MKKNLKHISKLLCLVLLSSIASCYKPKTKVVEEEKETTYYSLKISTNNQEANNYSVNVDNLDKIEEGTEVTITNTPGHYKIVQFLNENNELLSENNSYSFTMDSNKEIRLNFIQSQKYLSNSNASINDKQIANIILMCGQSNMCGTDDSYNNLSSDVISYYRKDHNNVLINYNGCVHNNHTYGKFGCGRFVPVDFGQGAKENFSGPEVGLSKYLGIKDPTTNYYLIKVAWGGSAIVSWTPNNVHWRNAYGKFITAVDNCFTNLISCNKIPIIKSMLWFQGESDSNQTEEIARSYSTKFKLFQNGFYNRYKNYLSTSFKWISAAISTTSPNWTYADIINEQLEEYSDCFIEETKTLERITDSHYTMTSYLTIGELFGRYYLN